MKKGKKLSRLVSSVLACCMMTTMFCLSAPSASAATADPANADPQVQLYCAQRFGPGEAAYNGYEGYIAAKNVGSQKNVTVHYTLDGTNWSDTSAQYDKADPNDTQYDVYTFYVFAPSAPLTFAVKYQVDGQTYWDNNNGSDYHVDSSANVVLGKSVVKVAQFNAVSPFEIYLKNLGYQKDVRVYYTTDGWKTTQNAQSQFVSSTNNVEVWRMPSNIPYGKNVQYYVSYVTNGVTYYDNNFGSNYIRY